MVRPTKRLLLDLAAASTFVVVVILDPQVGELSGPLGQPTGPWTVALMYLVTAGLAILGLNDIRKMVRSGGAILVGRKLRRVVEIDAEAWSLVGPIRLSHGQGLWYDVTIVSSSHELIRLTFGLARSGKHLTPGEISFVGDKKSIECAWEAESISDDVVAPPEPGQYMLTVRVESPEKARVKLKIACAPTRVGR